MVENAHEQHKVEVSVPVREIVHLTMAHVHLVAVSELFDNPSGLLAETAKFTPFNVFQIYPVVDMDEWAQAAQGGIDFRG